MQRIKEGPALNKGEVGKISKKIFHVSNKTEKEEELEDLVKTERFVCM